MTEENVFIKTSRWSRAKKYHRPHRDRSRFSKVACGHADYYSRLYLTKVSREEAEGLGYYACKNCYRVAGGVLYYPGPPT